MRCAACSNEVPQTACFCDACGAAVYQQAPPVPPPGLADGDAPVPRRRLWWWLGASLAGMAVAGAASGLMTSAPPQVSANTLEDAVRTTVTQGDGPGRDPICVANGLAYDSQPVNVQLGNAGTLAWMDALAAAGLYGPGEEAQPGGLLSQPIRTYSPRPALADWSGARHLCVARAMKLEAVRNLGTVQSMRFRGRAYPGVAAEVVWTLDGPAPWLGMPEVAAAFSAELPSWRGARWEVTPEGWRLVQRRNFFLSGTQWLTSESLDRVAGVAPRSTLPP